LLYGIPTGEQQDNQEDVGDKYTNYSSRTPIGSRNQIIIELYGAVTPYTVYRYWWVDSVVKKTIMLLDKSGLRKKGTIPPDPNWVDPNPEMSDEEFDKMLGAFGFSSVNRETDEQKAERIRTELNK